MPAFERLALFPLSNVVLFPRVKTPLHIFEPRYRQMTEAALDGDRRIGMVVVRPEHVEAIAGDPPLFEVGCEGVISDSKKLPGDAALSHRARDRARCGAALPHR